MFKGSLEKWLKANSLPRDVRAIDTGMLKTRGFPADFGSLPALEEIVFRSETGNTLATVKSVPPTLRCVGFVYCKTTTLPDAVFAHDAIEMLMVEGCGVKSLPARVGQLPKLRGVCFYLCSMKEIPDILFKNPSVTHAVFSSMMVTSIPDCFDKWPNLVSLQLAENTNLLGLPKSVCGLAHLEELVVSGSSCISIPAEIAACTTLRKLDMSRLNFQSFPPFITQLSLLEELDLSFNHIDVIPGDIANLAHLRSLNISNNPVDKIEALPSVEKLKARRTRLSSLGFLIPESAACLTELDISENNIRDLSNLGHAQKVRELDISEMGLDAFPPQVSELPELDVLYANSNNIREVPLLRSTTKLHLNKNPIESIEMPPNIVLLNLEAIAQKGKAGIESVKGLVGSKTLEKLNLTGNRLCRVPAFVDDCTNLRVLVLKNNLLKHVPAYAPLRHLELAQNELEAIDEWAVAMKDLVYFGVSGNGKIACVPEGLCALPRLEYLAINGTSVKEKPADFGANGRMVAVDSYGNYATADTASTPFAQLEPFAAIYKK